MHARVTLPIPKLDALPLGAHRLMVLTDEALFGACRTRIAFTGRDGGVSEGDFATLNLCDYVEDDPRAVKRNRAILLDAMGCKDAQVISLRQVHGEHIVSVRDASDVARALAEAREGADGVVVRDSQVAAMLFSADCLLLIVVAPSGRFAIAHAGWRGAVAGIAAKAVRALAAAELAEAGRAEGGCAEAGCAEGGRAEVDPAEARRAGSDLLEQVASTFNVYIGPHIGIECFEVGEEVASQFAERFGEGVVSRSYGEKPHVDLARAVVADVVSAGADLARIADSGICTKCNADRFYSYRATDGACGRHAAVACTC